MNMKEMDKSGRKSMATPKWKHFLDIPNQPMPEMGTTPRVPIWNKNKSTLWYYPPIKKKYKVPVFLIYSLINTPVILDLGPGNSLIEGFVNEGFEVYLIDFGSPGYEDGDITIDDYIVKYIRSGVRRALLHSGASEISIMGFCLGGTIATMYAAIANEPIRNLILSVTPIDFGTSPVFDQWLASMRDGSANFDEVLDIMKVIPASGVKDGIRLMTSPIYFSPYLSLLNQADNEQYIQNWRRFNAWTNGHVPLSAAVAKQLTDDLIINNRLVKGNLKVKGEKAKITNIDANVLVVASENDRLVPQEMISPIMKLLKSKDKTYKLLQSGHASNNYAGKLPQYLKEWLPERSSPIRKVK